MYIIYIYIYIYTQHPPFLTLHILGEGLPTALNIIECNSSGFPPSHECNSTVLNICFMICLNFNDSNVFA